MKEATPHLRVRLEASLLRKLEASRKKSGRTLTGEISKRLEQSYQDDRDALMQFLIRDAIAVEACLGG